jgi:hypothetical protein
VGPGAPGPLIGPPLNINLTRLIKQVRPINSNSLISCQVMSHV